MTGFKDIAIDGTAFINYEQDGMTMNNLMRESINRSPVLRHAVAQGFHIFTPSHGFDNKLDYIFYNETDNCLRKVKMTGRWTIDRRYLHRDIWMLFAIDRDWYLMPHDLMVEHSPHTRSDSWSIRGHFHNGKPSLDTREKCAPYLFFAEPTAAEPPEAA